MKAIQIDDVVTATKGRLFGEAHGTVTMVTMDSRKVKKGALFVAIKGERVDGHDFIREVFEKGASCVLCTHVPKGVSGCCVVVEDSVKGLQDLATWYRKALQVTVVGITGSVGKTSTKEMVAGVLSAHFKVQKTIGNYNNEIGLPLTVLDLEEDTEVSVLEMGISDFGEMRVLTNVANPDICVITNIGQSHLENLGTRDGILKAKTEIFENRNPKGPVFLNGDDDKLCTVKDVDGTKTTFYGFGRDNYAHPENVKSLGLGGTEMTIVLGSERFDAKITMIGNHMVANACVAAAIGKHLGMSNEEIARGLLACETISGRSNLIPLRGGYIIDDCYNAAPTSMRAAIDTLALASGRKIAILGDMFELGKDEVKMHAEIGTYATTKEIDLLMCVGKLSRAMYDAAASSMRERTVYFEDVEALLGKISSYVQEKDNILVKASNGMHFSKIVDTLKELQ